MRLSKDDIELIQKLIIVFKNPEIIKEDLFFNHEIMRESLSSIIPDINYMGLYCLSQIPPKNHPKFTLTNEIYLKNYAKYLSTLDKMYLEIHLRDFFTPHTVEYNSILSEIENLQLKKTQQNNSGRGVHSAGDMTIIIHGTWAASDDWWRPNGRLWQYINTMTGNVYSGNDPFSWSGGNSTDDRRIAAENLFTWVNNHPADNLDIIAHSHGGNVCFLATRLGLKIRRLITLGTPIRTEFIPDLRKIDILHNIFSTWDSVQTPFGTYPNKRAEGRTLADSSKLLNHHATEDGYGGCPGHSDLHERETWIANKFDELLR